MRGRISLIVGWGTMFLIGIDLFVVSPLLPFISETFRISTAMTGWMVTAFAVTYALFIPLFGSLADKYGRKEFIMFGLVLFVISSLLTAFSPTFFWLVVSRILTGLSVASITPVIYAIIGDTAPPSRTGTWLSITVSGHISALGLGAPLGTLLEHFFGWQSVFVVLAIMGVLMAVVNFKTWNKNLKSNSIRNLFEGHLLKIFASVSVTTCWAISMYALYVYLGAALYAENKFSSAQVALAITVFGIGAIIGSLTGGQLTDRFGEKKISKVTISLLMVILIFIGIFFTYSHLIYFLLFIWALVGYTAFTSYKARLAVEYVNDKGIAMAWNMTALYIGMTLGSLIGGFVISNWGYVFLPYVCSVAAMVSLILSTKE